MLLYHSARLTLAMKVSKNTLMQNRQLRHLCHLLSLMIAMECCTLIYLHADYLIPSRAAAPKSWLPEQRDGTWYMGNDWTVVKSYLRHSLKGSHDRDLHNRLKGWIIDNWDKWFFDYLVSSWLFLVVTWVPWLARCGVLGWVIFGSCRVVKRSFKFIGDDGFD